MNYYQTNHKEIHAILASNNGVLEVRHIYEMFHAFQIASGQTYFHARFMAILDYLREHGAVAIQYPDEQVTLRTPEELEACLKRHDSQFSLSGQGA